MGDSHGSGARAQRTHVHHEQQILRTLTASVHFDQRLARYEVLSAIAHARMLHHQQIIPERDAAMLLEALETVLRRIEGGQFTTSDRDEDVHGAIDRHLRDLVGTTAQLLSTAKARNDQAVTSLRMYVRDQVDASLRRLDALTQAVLTLAEHSVDAVMPGFTHMQFAQPVTFGHYCMAFAEMLDRDFLRFSNARGLLDESPLGTCALAGTALPIDRQMTAAMLGFSRPCANSIDGVGDRDFVLDFLSASATLAVHLSRITEDLVVFVSQPFGFLRLAPAHTSGSSIIPHKRNPDVIELIRAKCGRVVGSLTASLMVMKGLSMGYSRDLQEDKESLFDCADTISVCLDAATLVFEQLEIDRARMREAASWNFLTSSDLVDWLVRERLMNSQRAHDVVSALVAAAQARGCALHQLPADIIHACSDSKVGQLPLLDAHASVASRSSFGGTAPVAVCEAIQAFRKRRENRINTRTRASSGAMPADVAPPDS